MKLNVRAMGWVTPAGIGGSASGDVLRLGSGKLPKLRSRDFLRTSHPRFGRFDLYAKAGFGAIALALQDARLDEWAQKRPIGLVVGTRRGCLETDLAYFKTAATDGGAMASPNLFAYTLPNCMLGEASIQFGLTGPCFVVDDPGPGQMDGIHTALDTVAWGLCETIVAGWCDVDSEVTDSDLPGPCGAVFAVLSRGSGGAPWQWDGRNLTYKTELVGDLERLARTVIENNTRQ